MVRRHAALIGAGLLLLTGCGQDPAGLPNATDFERAQRVWSDPWLAPSSASVPEAAWGSPDGYVHREAGTRSTRYLAGRPGAVLRREVDAALAAGWILTGAICGDEPAASLAKGEGLGSGATALASTTASDGATEFSVTGSVPHHLDGSWPDPGAGLDPADSCLRGGEDRPLADDLGLGEPLDPGDAPDEPEATTWQRSELTTGEETLLAAVNADPWIQNAGLVLGSRLEADDALRRAPVAETTVPDAALVDVFMDMRNWYPTWLACGRGRPGEATLRLDTDAGTAVARLTEVPGGTEVTVTLPIPETPPPVWISEIPPAEDQNCLAGGAPRGGGLAVVGTPATTASESQPYAG